MPGQVDADDVLGRWARYAAKLVHQLSEAVGGGIGVITHVLRSTPCRLSIISR
jgi:hypothetical protein